MKSEPTTRTRSRDSSAAAFASTDTRSLRKKLRPAPMPPPVPNCGSNRMPGENETLCPVRRAPSASNRKSIRLCAASGTAMRTARSANVSLYIKVTKEQEACAAESRPLARSFACREGGLNVQAFHHVTHPCRGAAPRAAAAAAEPTNIRREGGRQSRAARRDRDRLTRQSDARPGQGRFHRPRERPAADGRYGRLLHEPPADRHTRGASQVQSRARARRPLSDLFLRQ